MEQGPEADAAAAELIALAREERAHELRERDCPRLRAHRSRMGPGPRTERAE